MRLLTTTCTGEPQDWIRNQTGGESIAVPFQPSWYPERPSLGLQAQLRATMSRRSHTPSWLAIVVKSDDCL